MAHESALHADPLSPGLRLGRYELIRRLAVGGMAEIYLARATGIQGFEKLVVLKRILPQFATNTDFVSMFLDEARLSATLQHPNIAQVHDIGEYNGSFFFTMEYIRGEDVRTILKHAVESKRRLPLSHSLTIIIGAAAGLHAAHEKRGLDGEPLNVVHRDVSPSNVLVSYDGAVKLVDFGVAKAAQRQTQTAAGTLKGKVAYMSPEQCRGKRLDRRSDIFALGILLYEISCQRRLFRGESEYDIMTKIVNEDVPPPSERFPRYPKELERILMRALRRNPEERYETAQQMQVDLEEFARRAWLLISTVKLGAFMQEMFVERMREQVAAITRRPSTEVGEEPLAEQSGLIESANDDGDDDDDVDIEIDVEDDPSEHGTRAEAAAVAAVSSAHLRRQRSSRVWQVLGIAGVAAAIAMYVVLSQQGSKTSHAEPAAAQVPDRVRGQVQVPDRGQDRVRGQVQVPDRVRGLVQAPDRVRGQVQVPGRAPVATPAPAAAPVAAPVPVAAPAPAATPAASQTSAKPKPQARKKRSKRRTTKARKAKRRSKAKAKSKPKPKKRATGWGMDSPLPPPKP